MELTKVVLAGAYGHGRSHLENVCALAAGGLVELVIVCDVRPVDAIWLHGLGATEQARPEDLGELIERTGAEITVLCTPIDTHADLAVTALRAGSHLLLEKPPAASLAGFERIAAAVRETGPACQVGFQNLGSTAVPALRELIGSGGLGEITGIGVAGAWERRIRHSVFSRSGMSRRDSSRWIVVLATARSRRRFPCGVRCRPGALVRPSASWHAPGQPEDGGSPVAIPGRRRSPPARRRNRTGGGRAGRW